jgi:hypothetical protein
MSDSTEVCASVVEFVPVDVIGLESVSAHKSEQLAMKVDDDATLVDGLTANGVSRLRENPPSPLVDEVGVGGINERICSDAAIPGVQGDENAIILVHRVPSELGVTPRPICRRSGAFVRSNYTRSLRVEAA